MPVEQKRKENRSGSNQGPSAYQPSALPLGHTGSHPPVARKPAINKAGFPVVRRHGSSSLSTFSHLTVKEYACDRWPDQKLYKGNTAIPPYSTVPVLITSIIIPFLLMPISSTISTHLFQVTLGCCLNQPTPSLTAYQVALCCNPPRYALSVQRPAYTPFLSPDVEPPRASPH